MLKLKKFMKMAAASLPLLSILSYFEMPFCGPCAFFFGEPDFPTDLEK